MTTKISRENAEAIIREQIVNNILQDTPKQSIFMNLAKKCLICHQIQLE